MEIDLELFHPPDSLQAPENFLGLEKILHSGRCVWHPLLLGYFRISVDLLLQMIVFDRRGGHETRRVDPKSTKIWSQMWMYGHCGRILGIWHFLSDL